VIYCPVCRTEYDTTAHWCPSVSKIFTPNPEHPEVEVQRLRASVAELEAENARLQECAKHQAQGPGGSKTIRVELLPRDDRWAMCVTFPSSMPDGEKAAFEVISGMLALLLETSKSLAEAANG